jgi:hypothetical protein
MKFNKKVEEYFKILEPDYPEWLDDYINTKELLSQQYISVTCGTIYSNLFESKFFFSSLDHSVAVALIVWHFTHDKKQTLAGLFHDIATPAFKHCVDFLNGDYMNQESTEDITTSIIKNSKEIMTLLKRDGIEVQEIDNYHLYPVADNDTPNLAADRLEYSFSNAYFIYELIDLKTIENFYNDIFVGKNEQGLDELSFKTKKIARDFVKMTSHLSIIYREDRTRYSMQLIADILKRLSDEGKITKQDLYVLKESEVIDIIKKSQYKNIYDLWTNATKVNVSKVEPKGVYYVHHGAKIRYIDPLCNGIRMSKACKIAKKMIDKNLSYDMTNYVYLDFNF